MQNFLRKLMQALGRIVEKVGGRGPKKKEAPGRSSPESPSERTAEITLPEVRVRRVIETLERQEAAAILPNLSGKKVLHATANGTRHWEALQQKGAKTILDFDVNPLFGPQLPAGVKPPGIHLVRGSFSASPFLDDTFDALVLFGAMTRADSLTQWMGEIARVLKDGARVVITFIHPYLEHQMNPRGGFPHGIDQYFMELRRKGIYVEEIREAKADDSVRSLFSPAKDDKDFTQIKGNPMVVIFKAIRLKRR